MEKSETQLYKYVDLNNLFKKNINLFGGKVEVRQPTLGTVLEARDEEDPKSALVRIMIEYCFVPGTDEKVFEEADKDAILNFPVGGWFSEFNSAVGELTNIDFDKAEKDLEARPTAKP